MVVVGCHSGAVFGFNSKNPSLLWALESPQPFSRSVLVAPLLLRDLAVLCSVSGEVAALSIQTGKIVRIPRPNVEITRILRCGCSDLTTQLPLLLVCSATKSASSPPLHCFFFRKPTEASIRATLSLLHAMRFTLLCCPDCLRLFVSARILATCNYYRLTLLVQTLKHQRLLTTLETLANFQFSAKVFSSPVYVGGCIYVGCRDDRVHCLSLVNRPSAALT